MRDSHGSGRRLPFVVLGLLVVVAAVIAIVVVERRSSGSPSAAASPSVGRTTSAAVTASPSASTSTPPRTAATQPAGITFGNHLFGLSRAKIDQALDDVVALHLTWIRVDMSWASLQPDSADSFDWAPLDAIVASARSRRLTVLGLLSYTPPWARSAGCSTFTCPPRQASEFARFAGAVAGRYRDDGVKDFQVWNEPNIDQFWTSPNPLRYRSLLSATVTALRATGGGLRILFGGLAVAPDSGGDLSAVTFLRRACAGRTCRVDAVGYDPYTYPAVPSRSSRPFNAVQLLINPAAGARGLPAALTAVGLGTTPVWITGFGAPTGGSTADGPDAVSEATQARIVTDGLRVARANAGRIGGFFVDTLRDSTAGSAADTHFGLERSDGSHKPAFAALAKALAR